MLKTLCNLNGVSGRTENITDFILNEIRGCSCKAELFENGNLIVYKKGRKTPKRKLMIDAHTDEVGLIVKDITDEGYLKIAEVGGLDERILLSQKVRVGANEINGVIGIKAVHMQTKEEREKIIPLSDMYVDIGASSKEDALKYVKRGDTIAFSSGYYELGGKIKAKALDDRAGTAILLELLKQDSEYDFTAAFSVSEEIGTVGAKAAAEYIKPELALILEGTTCSDVPDTRPHEQSTNQGRGAALSIADRTSYSDKLLNKFIIKLAEENKVPFQFKRTTAGGNDAGAIQTAAGGVKTAVISVPVRYIHSPVSVMDMRDYESALKLAQLFVNNFGKEEFLYE